MFDSVKKATEEFSKISETIIKSIPKFELPKFDIPKIHIDYKKIRSLTVNNSIYGWTLTGEMDLGVYLNKELLNKGLVLDVKDQYFYDYYKSDNWRNYYETKKIITSKITPKWRGLINDCFESFENDKHQLIIPVLISIIEGEISEITKTHNVGQDLLESLKGEIDTEEDKFDAILIFSLYTFLKEELFRGRNFSYRRRKLINRNWVLHGRDDPKHWKKVDALRLINVLSTIQFAKKILKQANTIK